MTYLIQKIKGLYKILVDKKYRADRIRNIAETKEQIRLRSLPKNISNKTWLLSNDFYFSDAVSFLGAKNEIWDREIYKFTTNNPTPYIIDAGANIGLSVIYFKKLYPQAELIAFEPDNTIFDILQQNIKNFDLDNVKLIKKGLWSEKKIISFFSEGNEAGHILSNQNIGVNKVEIQTDILSRYLNKKVDFLKVDIEGAELEVLQECKHLLFNVDKLFVEYHSYENKPQKLDEIIKILSEAGFRLHIQDNLPFSSNPFISVKKYLNIDMLLNIFAFR
jgi:FkbM family methyltransferase